MLTLGKNIPFLSLGVAVHKHDVCNQQELQTSRRTAAGSNATHMGGERDSGPCLGSSPGQEELTRSLLFLKRDTVAFVLF
jgi:hypothetical protein